MEYHDIGHWQSFDIDCVSQPGRITCRMPERDEHVLSGAAALWAGKTNDWQERRSHKWGGRVIVGRLPGVPNPLVFKQFTLRNPRYIHKAYRATRTIRQEQAAARAGFSVARTRCILKRRRFGIVVESALLFDAFDGAVPVYHLLNKPELGVNSNREKRRALLRALGDEVGRWHRAGLYHGDLHTGNILVSVQPEGYVFHWIDNEEGRLYRNIPLPQRIADLNHINRLDYNVSLTDRARFWDAYCKASDLKAPETKKIARKVLRLSSKYRRKRAMG